MQIAAVHAQPGTGDTSLTFGGELRLRYEGYDNNEFGSARKPDEGYFRFRALPYADLHLGPRFRLFGQLQAAWSTRSDALKNPLTDETGLDAAQAFADWRVPLGEQVRLTLRGGRQVLQYGSQRLISTGPNIRFMFDGAMVRWESAGWRVDVLAVRPVKPGLNWFDDRRDSSRSLGTVYATRALPAIGPGSGMDLYYMRFENDAAAFNQGTGPERRHTFGTRAFGTRGPWSWDVETNLQTGDFAGGDIRAGSLDTALRRTFEKSPYRPYFEVRANIISGDADQNDRRLGTFNAMFSTAEYFGDIGQIGPANLINLRPNFGMDLGAGWKLSGAATLFWRQRLDDGIYGVALNLLRPDGGSRARYIGAQADVALDWQVNRNLSFRFVYALFAPGRFIEETGPASTVHFVQANAVFKH